MTQLLHFDIQSSYSPDSSAAPFFVDSEGCRIMLAVTSRMPGTSLAAVSENQDGYRLSQDVAESASAQFSRKIIQQ